MTTTNTNSVSAVASEIPTYEQIISKGNPYRMIRHEGRDRAWLYNIDGVEYVVFHTHHNWDDVIAVKTRQYIQTAADETLYNEHIFKCFEKDTNGYAEIPIWHDDNTDTFEMEYKHCAIQNLLHCNPNLRDDKKYKRAIADFDIVDTGDDPEVGKEAEYVSTIRMVWAKLFNIKSSNPREGYKFSKYSTASKPTPPCAIDWEGRVSRTEDEQYQRDLKAWYDAQAI